jgi:two-component system, OmpR family, sensor kinase
VIIYSVRLKLTAWYVALLGSILILFSFLLFFFLSKRLYEGVDNSLKISANVVAKTALTRYTSAPLPGLENFLEQFLGYGNINKFYRIYDGSGNVGSLSKNIEPSQFPLTEESYAKALEGKSSYETFTLSENQNIRVLTRPVLRGGKLVNLIQVGTSLMAVNETMKNLKIFLYTAVPAVLVLATLVGGFMARRALRPVDKINQTARKIGSGADLSRRIPVPEAQDEIGRLAQTFNEMLERLENFFIQVRQFSSDASHELRTPLTVLKGQSELALRKVRTPEEYQEVISSNLEEINYMSEILEDLFYLSKADEAEIQLEFKPLALDLLTEDICKHAEIIASEKQIEIIIAFLEPVEVIGDAVRLKQTLWNLLNNAIKYTPNEGRIKVYLQNKNDIAVLSIEDTGIGIPKEDLDFIFNRFYRVEKSRSRTEGGSGLGLAISKYIIEAHKGIIEVESQVGVGTKFKISLPKTTTTTLAPAKVVS